MQSLQMIGGASAFVTLVDRLRVYICCRWPVLSFRSLDKG